MRSDEEINPVVRIRFVIIILYCWLISLWRLLSLLVMLATAAIVGAYLAQLMFLVDLGHLPLDVIRVLVSRVHGAGWEITGPGWA